MTHSITSRNYLLDSVCSVACVNVIPFLFVQRRSYAIFFYFLSFFPSSWRMLSCFYRVCCKKKFSIIWEDSIDFMICMTLGYSWKFNNVLWRIHRPTDTYVRLHHLQFTICVLDDHGVRLCCYIHHFFDYVSEI